MSILTRQLCSIRVGKFFIGLPPGDPLWRWDDKAIIHFAVFCGWFSGLKIGGKLFPFIQPKPQQLAVTKGWVENFSEIFSSSFSRAGSWWAKLKQISRNLNQQWCFRLANPINFLLNFTSNKISGEVRGSYFMTSSRKQRKRIKLVSHRKKLEDVRNHGYSWSIKTWK